MNRKFTDRSRILAHQRCPRRCWHEYHDGPEQLGIVPRKTALPLVVGGAWHAGGAVLLREGSRYLASDKEAFCGGLADTVNQRSIEELAVAAALTEFRARTGEGGLELDLSEQAAQTAAFVDLEAQLRGTLGLADDELSTRVLDAKGKADQYLAKEQEALVEALVRAYARRRLRPLLEQYEVLEVEREGDWLLSAWNMATSYDDISNTESSEPRELWFASRPDALLRDRESNALYILSFKTAATWDIRKERDAERDMQGLSEGVEVEKRLGELWAALKGNHTIDFGQTTQEMCVWLKTLDSPPRILGIRYEYMFKSYRGKDKDLTREFGIEAYVQKSHLVRRWRCVSTPAKGKNVGSFALGDTCWAYEFHLEDGSESKLAWQNWRQEPVWEQAGGVKAWIDQLDASAEAMSSEDASSGFEPRALGWSGPAQRVGYTSVHPLDDVFHAPMIVYRNEDQVRDWFEQVEAQERRVAESVEQVRAVEHDERRTKLNVLFPMYRQSCEYPTTCPYVPICYGADHVQADPMGTGRYRVRTPNHPQELQKGEA